MEVRAHPLQVPVEGSGASSGASGSGGRSRDGEVEGETGLGTSSFFTSMGARGAVSSGNSTGSVLGILETGEDSKGVSIFFSIFGWSETGGRSRPSEVGFSWATEESDDGLGPVELGDLTGEDSPPNLLS